MRTLYDKKAFSRLRKIAGLKDVMVHKGDALDATLPSLIPKEAGELGGRLKEISKSITEARIKGALDKCVAFMEENDSTHAMVRLNLKGGSTDTWELMKWAPTNGSTATEHPQTCADSGPLGFWRPAKVRPDTEPQGGVTAGLGISCKATSASHWSCSGPWAQ